MIICNGVVGLCLLVGSLRHDVLAFRVEGTTPALAVLTTLTTLTLVLPTFTTSTAGPTFSSAQLVFAGAVSLVLYAVFVSIQTGRHRDFFLPEGVESEEAHAVPPGAFVAWLSLRAVAGFPRRCRAPCQSAVSRHREGSCSGGNASRRCRHRYRAHRVAARNLGRRAGSRP